MRRPALLALVVTFLASSAAGAAHGRRDSAGPDIERTESAATECLAQAVMANPGAAAKARAGLWYEAAGVMGFICRPEVGEMIRVRDRAEGRGAGMRHFRNVYVRRLATTLSARLAPDLSLAVADAEPPLDDKGE